MNEADIVKAYKILKDFVDSGEPKRTPYELWTNWQSRVSLWKEARELVEKIKPEEV
jgi:hypothetical protein